MDLKIDISSTNMDIDVDDLSNSERNDEVEENGKRDTQIVEEPKLHMVFDNIDEVYEYYRKYGAQQGFGVTKRSTKKLNGVIKYFTVVCHKYGEPKKNSKITLKPHPIIKAGCNAKIYAKLCKHIVKVLHFERFIFTVPTKYILRRWRKDIKRRHTKAKVTYNVWKDTEPGQRYDKVCNIFFDVADIAYDTQKRCNQLVDLLLELKEEWNTEDGVGEKIQPTQKLTATESENNGPNESHKLLSPKKNRCKGCPPIKRKIGKIEQISKKFKLKGKKCRIESESTNTKNMNEVQENHHRNINLNESIWGDEFLNLGAVWNFGSIGEDTSNVG